MKWRKPKRFDANLIVIGAGSAGLIAALIGATVKAKVVLIEKGAMGGDCLNTGCVPSKTLIASARVAHTVAQGERFGLRDVSFDVDFGAVMARVRRVIEAIAPNDSIERYTGLGVECVQGQARLVDPWTVEVEAHRITARSIVLATGASPAVPTIPGLDAMRALTSDSVWNLKARPSRLLVMGAGPIGCELAQAFQRLGSQVTLIDMEARVLPREDADVSAAVAQALGEDGVTVRVGHRAERFGTDESGRFLIARATDQEAQEVKLGFDEVLVAVGRRAHPEALGLAALGIETRRDGTIVVDRYLRTRMKSIFACGDVTGPYQFTHIASHQAWYAAVNALFGRFWKFAANYAVVPWCTYTDPEAARVGLSEEEAARAGVEYEVSRHPLAHLDRALAEGAELGFIKVLTHKRSDRILGAAIVAPQAGELIGEYVSAMTHGLGLKQIQGTIHIYPTLAELNKSAANAWRRAHAPERLLRWVGRFHALWR